MKRAGVSLDAAPARASPAEYSSYHRASLLEIALYVANQGASGETPDQIWVQFHQPFDQDVAARAAQLLDELGFESALPPGVMFYVSFAEREDLAAAANELLEAVAELPVRFQMRICLPHENTQVFLAETLLRKLVCGEAN